MRFPISRLAYFFGYFTSALYVIAALVVTATIPRTTNS
jgi:hypothetical protein